MRHQMTLPSSSRFGLYVFSLHLVVDLGFYFLGPAQICKKNGWLPMTVTVAKLHIWADGVKAELFVAIWNRTDGKYIDRLLALPLSIFNS